MPDLSPRHGRLSRALRSPAWRRLAQPRRLLALSCACFSGSAALLACQSGEGDFFVGPFDAGTVSDASSDGGGSKDGGGGTTTGDGGVVTVQILAFNDFHGNLRPPSAPPSMWN